MSKQDRDEFPLGEVSPDDTRTELACGSTKMVILYLEEVYGKQMADNVAWSTRMNRSYIEDAHNWVSMDYYYRFLDEVVKQTGDSKAPFEAGTYAVRPECFGAMATLLLRLGTVRGAYALLPKFSHHLCRVAVWEHVSTGPNSCLLTFRFPQHKQNRHNCLAIQAAIVSLPELNGCPRATIRHTECACDGNMGCVYELSWVEKPAQIRALTGALAGLCVGFAMTLLHDGGWWLPYIGYTLGLVGYLGGRILDYSKRLQESYAYNKQQSDSLEKSMKKTERLNQNLQRQVVERTDALQKAYSELQKSRDKELAQQRFAAIGTLASGMAHELNTPLNTIQLGVQELLESPSGNHNDVELGNHVRRAARRCSRIVGELLAFSREPQTVSAMRLHQVVEASLAIFDNEKPDGISVERELATPPPIANVDGAQIQQVLLNLLSNAVDAMQRKGVITVRLQAEDGYALVEVADQGPGVPKDRRRQIFEPFESTKRSTGKGLGLGLSIAAELVAKNGGNISVGNNQVGQGACFTIRFPIASPDSAEGAHVESVDSLPPIAHANGLFTEPVDAEPGKIEPNHPSFSTDAVNMLLVEDDKDAGLTLKRMLERHDVRVTHVTSGQQCIENFDSECFDAVVTDVLLGDMTGVDVLRAIRETDEIFPVILITGHDSIGSAVEALRLGAQDYIRKPLESIEEIIQPVRNAVAHHKLLCSSQNVNKDLAASELRFRSLSKLLPETVFESDTEGCVTFLNMAGKARFGITDDMLQAGFYLYQGVSPQDAEKVNSTLTRVLSGETMSGVEFDGLSQSGQTFPVLTFSTPIWSNKTIAGIRAIVVDITKQKEFEKELLHYQNTLRQMDAQLQVTAEKERCKLAGDLHDSVAQLLTAAKMHVGLCVRARDHERRSRHLSLANDILADALQQTRTLVFQLSPPALYSEGLQAGVEDLAGHMLPVHGLNVTFYGCEDPVCLDEEARVHVFRAVRELLINVAKHSGCKECVVTVSQQQEEVFVSVEDQGVGFDYSARKQYFDGGGFGLFGISEHLKTIGGSLDIQSELGKGTTAVVSVPISAE